MEKNNSPLFSYFRIIKVIPNKEQWEQIVSHMRLLYPMFDLSGVQLLQSKEEKSENKNDKDKDNDKHGDCDDILQPEEEKHMAPMLNITQKLICENRGEKPMLRFIPDHESKDFIQQFIFREFKRSIRTVLWTDEKWKGKVSLFFKHMNQCMEISRECAYELLPTNINLNPFQASHFSFFMSYHIFHLFWYQMDGEIRKLMEETFDFFRKQCYLGPECGPFSQYLPRFNWIQFMNVFSEKTKK